ncbi:MAG: hypothetical protein ACOCYZ_00940, partial [Halococcoides sp.]
MKASRVDFIVDLSFGALIFVSIGIILVAETSVGIAFGLGALVTYVIHVGWKMARFDPDWMTRDVAERVQESVSETVSEEVEQTVEKTVSDEV